MKNTFRILALVAALTPSTLLAQDFDTGMAAYTAADFPNALAEWLPLAEAGDMQAQYYLAQMYRRGEGTAQNDTEARHWYHKAAQQGDKFAQYNLAYMYQNGRGGAEDVEAAIVWFRRAAEQGMVNAMYNLGQIHLHGGPVSATEAAQSFRAASTLGHSYAQHNLGGMYLLGKGVPQSNTLAHMWFEIAFINGDNKGASSMERAGQDMTMDEIIEARRKVWDCMGSGYKECG